MASLVTTTVTGTLTTTDDIILTGTRAIKNTTSAGILTIQGGASWPGGRIILGGGNAAGGDIKFYTGLSTDAPTERLEISATGTTTITGTALATDPVLAINSASSGSFLHMLEAFSASMASGNTNILVFGSAGSSGNSAYIGYRSYGDNNADNVLTLGHWSYNHLVNIKRDGNVGIGTTGPASFLHLYSSAQRQFHWYAGTSPSGNNYVSTIGLGRDKGAASMFEIKYNSEGSEHAYISRLYPNAVLHFDKSGTDHMTILADGNVGIGINAPYSKFEVAIAPTVAATTVNETADFTDKIVISNSGTSALGDRIPLVFNIGGDGADNISTAIVGEREASGWNSALSFWVNGVTSGAEGTDAIQEAMRINSSGNVGIGTTAPEGLLSFKADESDTPKIRFQNQHSDNADAAISTYDDTSGTTVLIGSNLYINSSGSTTRFNTGEESAGFRADRGGLLQFFTGGTGATASERIRVLADGNVGIGTDAAGTILHIKQDDAVGPTISLTNNSKTSYINLWGATGGGTDRTNQFEINAVNTGYGITLASTDYVRFKTNGIAASDEAMRINSDGNVGIGTTDPGVLLEISDTNPAFDIAQSGTTIFRTELDGANDVYQTVYGAGNQWILRTNGGTAALTINASQSASFAGAITAPSITLSSFLNVTGTGGSATFSGDMTIAGELLIGSATYTGGKLMVSNSDNTVYDASQASHQRDNGSTLMINNESTTAGSFSQILLRNRSSDVGGCRIVSIDSGANDSELAIVTGDTGESMRILGDGKVGIGTTTPTNNLVVYATGHQVNFVTETDDHSGMRVKGAAAKDKYILFNDQCKIGYQHSTATLHLCRSAAFGDNHLVINSSGSVGIGTDNPGQMLSVFQGKIGVTDAYMIGNLDGNTGMLTYSSNRVTWEIGGSEKMRLNSSGSVGIGTTNPGAKLEIETDSNVIKGLIVDANSSVYAETAVTIGCERTASNAYTLLDCVIDSDGTPASALKVQGDGVVSLSSAGNTLVNNYYASLIINNTGTSTWSRLRFDRSGVERWGIGLGTDDKLRISNLFTGGSAASPNDNCFVIDNNGQIGINMNPDGELAVKASADGVNVLNLVSSANDALFNVRQSSDDCLIRGYKVGGAQTIQLHSDGSSYFTGGNVGIGTTDPGSLLTISGNSDNGDGASALRIIDEDSTGGSKLPAIMFYGGSTMQGRIRGGDGSFAIAVGSTPTTALSIDTSSQAVTLSNNLTLSSKITFSGGSDQYLEIGTNAIALKNSSGSVLWNSASSGSGTVTSVAVTVGTGLDVSGSPITSSGTIDIDLDLSEFTDMTADITTTDEVILLDSGSERRKAFGELKLSKFNNDSGWTSNAGDMSTDDYAIFQNLKSPGSSSGGLTQDTWVKRTLQTTPTNNITNASLTSSVITLPAGTYYCRFWGSAYYCGAHQARLRDTTSSVTLLYGSSELAWVASPYPASHSVGQGMFTLSGLSTLEFQHIAGETSSTHGQGRRVGSSSSGDVDTGDLQKELYCAIEFWKV